MDQSLAAAQFPNGIQTEYSAVVLQSQYFATMATITTTDPTIADPLLAFRRILSPSSPHQPILTTSSDLSADDKTDDITQATHLVFLHSIAQSFELSTPTRFVSAAAGNKQIDLRSIYFAWLKKDVAIPDYITEAQSVNEILAAKAAEEGKDEESAQKVIHLVFVERLDLITWLEGASEESEYIKPLEGVVPSGAAGDKAATAPGVGAAKTAAGAAGIVHVGGRPVKVIDPRLQEIYDGERKMGDRNTVLRGIRPTDFSHIRKTAELFLGRNRRSGQQPGKPGARPTSIAGSIPKPVSGSSRHNSVSPIVILSPSASSLLRMSNIKSFLQEGVYVPADHPTLATHTATNLLQVQREVNMGPRIQGSGVPSSHTASTRKPLRFILVDSTTDFKPDYWNRVVAVFTTGQTWQFKSYKWSSPPELFKRATGIYVGWTGEEVPAQVRGWGRGMGREGSAARQSNEQSLIDAK
ncbi:accessory factor associated with RNA polymerase II [Ascosphaera aggregata]|nr:accessory factor associated with RNA polymerase II [Ascosphaera aggregata]